MNSYTTIAKTKIVEIYRKKTCKFTGFSKQKNVPRTGTMNEFIITEHTMKDRLLDSFCGVIINPGWALQGEMMPELSLQDD